MIAQKQTSRDTVTATTQIIEAPGLYETDPARVQRLAILCGGTLFAFRHTDPRTLPAAEDRLLPVEEAWELTGDYDLHDLGQAAALNKIGAVWLIPAFGARPTAFDLPLVHDFASAAHAQLTRTDHLLLWHPLTAGRPPTLCGLVCQWRRGDGTGVGMPIGVYAPWLGDKGGTWGFGGKLGTLAGTPETRARIVATALALAAYTLRQQLRFSPGYTGGQILRTVIAHKQESRKIGPLPALSEEFRALLLDQFCPHPLQWARPIERDAEITRRDGSALIFKFDRTSSYPASAGEVPCGDPTPTKAYVRGCPGVYLLSATAPAHWDYTRLPGLFYDPLDRDHASYPWAVDSVWAWEPQIRLAEKLGWSVRVHAGYYWPRSQVHDLFRPWRERLFAAREACAAEGTPGRLAAALIKLAAVATIGRLIAAGGEQMMDLDAALASGRTVRSVDVDDRGAVTGLVSVDADPGRSDLLWPQAWGTIIANANERIQSAICTVAPRDTLAAYVDALYCLRAHPELVGAPDGRAQLGRFRLDRVLLARAHDLDVMRGQSAESWVKTAAHLTLLAGAPEESESDGEGAE